MVAKTFVVDKAAVGQPVRCPGLTSSPVITTAAGTTPWADRFRPSFPAPTAQHGPQWDEARGTYIQWDPELKAWMQWDESARVWNRSPVPSRAAPTAPSLPLPLRPPGS